MMNIAAILHNWIENKTTLLDLGCGDGSMLLHFQKVKQIQGLGIEINADNIQKCLEKGVNVIEHNIEGLQAARAELLALLGTTDKHWISPQI